MANLQTLLSKLGFQYKEIQIYLALQAVGTQPASVVADKTGINRVTSYNLLQKLVDKGLVQSIKRGNIQYFSTGEVTSLSSYAERKCEELRILSQDLKQALARIPQGQDDNNSSFFAKIFSGVDGVKAFMYEELLHSDHIFLSLNLKSADIMRFTTEVFLPKLRRKEYIKGEIYLPSAYVEHVHMLFQDTPLQVRSCPLGMQSKNFCVSNNTILGLFSEDQNIIQALRIQSPSLSHNAINSFHERYSLRTPEKQFILREKSNESYGTQEETT